MSRLETGSPSPGSIFAGKYEILDEIGSGSFGSVHRARQLSTGQLVAIKLQRTSDGASEDALERMRQRFRREMALCAELAHPNVVRLLDSSEPDASPLYAVFEYVPGATLARLLAEGGPLPAREVGRLMAQVLDALAAAHRQGIVHRDLKTDNVMVSGTGALRNAHVLDFGLGGFVEERRQAERRVTLSREFLGTPLYASPEQLRGEPASPRSDLYAWGLILLECLTGQHVFEGPDTIGLRFPHDGATEIELPDPLRDHPLGELIARVTAYDPAKRDLEPAEILRILDDIDWSELASRLASPARLPAPRGARRQVTILSCRAQVSSDADFEARHAIHRTCYAICAEAATRFGGHVSSALGDRVLLYFGFPIAHESDARRAARAALEISSRIGEHAKSMRSRDGAHADVHVGLHTGPVIARDTRGAGAPQEVDLAGSTAAIAAQLDAFAGPGQILLGETTRRLLRGTLATRRLREPLAGSAPPMPVHRLELDAKEDADPESAPQRMAGRELELHQLGLALEEARSGRPRCTVVAGEPGIGKSRLVRALQQREPGVRWLFCRCLEDTRDTPLHPVIALLRSLDGPIPEILRRYGLDPADYAALFRRLLGLPDDDSFPAPQLSPDREKFMLLDGLSRLLLATAREGPVVLVVEDVHWADPTTRELLAEVVGRMNLDDERPRLLLLLTSRDWAPTGSSVVTLQRLTREEVLAMVRGTPALAAPLDDELLDLIVEKADGIPLFVEEVARVLAEQRRSPGAAGSGRRDLALQIPAELEALLQARLDTLSEPARATTQLAAALGREFSFALLKAASGASDSELEQDLGELMREGFVLLRRSADGESYHFKHAMIRDAAYATMLGDARRDRHSRIAALLEGDFSELARRQPEVLARHLEGAGEKQRAVGAWREAGESAMAKGAYVEAIRHFERGLLAVADVEDVGRSRRMEFELTGLLGTALVATSGYAAPRVEETFARASAICHELGEDLPLDLLYGLWSVHLVRGDVEATEALVPRFERLARREEDDFGRLTVHAVIGLRALLQGRLDEADAELEQAVRILDRPGSVEQLARMPYSGAVYPIAWRMLLLLYRGHPERAIESRDHLNEIAQRLGNPYGVAVAGHFSALLARDLDDVEGARQLAERQIAHSTEQKILLWQCSSACIRGWARACEGDEAGVQELAMNVAVLRGIGLKTTLPTLLSFLAEAQLATGATEEARASVAGARADCERILDRYYLAELFRIEGRALVGLGDEAGARALFEQALEVAERQGAPWFALRAATELARLEAHGERAGTALERLGSALSAIEGGATTQPVTQARELLKRASEPSGARPR